MCLEPKRTGAVRARPCLRLRARRADTLQPRLRRRQHARVPLGQASAKDCCMSYATCTVLADGTVRRRRGSCDVLMMLLIWHRWCRRWLRALPAGADGQRASNAGPVDEAIGGEHLRLDRPRSQPPEMQVAKGRKGRRKEGRRGGGGSQWSAAYAICDGRITSYIYIYVSRHTWKALAAVACFRFNQEPALVLLSYAYTYLSIWHGAYLYIYMPTSAL